MSRSATCPPRIGARFLISEFCGFVYSYRLILQACTCEKMLHQIAVALRLDRTWSPSSGAHIAPSARLRPDGPPDIEFWRQFVGFPDSNNKPDFPSSTMYGKPPMRDAITGLHAMNPSSAVTGKFSYHSDGSTRQNEFRRISHFSVPLLKPSNSIFRIPLSRM